MKKFYRLTALVLSVLLLTIGTVACADKGDITTETSGSAATETTAAGTLAETTAETSKHDTSDLPERNLGGFEYRILSMDTNWDSIRLNTIVADAISGEIINDTIYARDLALTEKYNFKFKYISNGTSDPAAAVRTSVLAGEDSCEIAVCALTTGLKYVTSGIFANMNEIPNVNTEKNYWNQSAISDLSIKGKVYFLLGDIMISDDDGLTLTMYNTAMAKDYDIPDLYALAREGKWTYDMMIANMKKVVSDLNSDGKYDSKDNIGLLFFKDSGLAQYYAAADTLLFTKDAEDVPCIISDTTRAVDVYGKIKELLTTPGYTYDWKGFGGSAEQIAGITTMIENKQVLFQNMIMSQVRRFYRDIKTDFGILPLPKFDENQECYCTYGNCHAIYIPATNKHLDETGFITEALGAASGELTDVYYGVCLESKYTRDEQSFEMIELATEKIIFDMGMIYGWGGLFTSLNTSLHAGNEFSAVYKSAEKIAEKEIAKFLTGE